MDRIKEKKGGQDAALIKMAQKELSELAGSTGYHGEDKPDSPQEKRLTEEEVRRQILQSTLNRASAIYQANEDSEKSKGKWRTFFMVFCCSLLLLTLLFVFVMVALGACGRVKIEKEVVIALLAYIVANFFTILIFMIKYVHNTQYLETFKTVTYKLLDYLLADKNGNGAVAEAEKEDAAKEKNKKEKQQTAG